MGTWFGPSDQWPVHTKPYWRLALERAREAGWHFQEFSGHTFGLVSCAREGEDRCKVIVYSTGSGGENVARELESRVKRCPHITSDSDVPNVETRLREASGYLGQADALVDAAERCLHAAEMRSKAQELLELAITSTSQAESLLDPETLFDQASSLDEAARGVESSALEDAATVGYADAPDSSGLLSAAVGRVSQAEGSLRQLGNRPERRDLLSRARTLRGRIRDLRLALGVGNGG